MKIYLVFSQSNYCGFGDEFDEPMLLDIFSTKEKAEVYINERNNEFVYDSEEDEYVYEAEDGLIVIDTIEEWEVK